MLRLIIRQKEPFAEALAQHLLVGPYEGPNLS